MSLYIGPQPDEFRFTPARTPAPGRSSSQARKAYPLGTILAASTLGATTLMFAALMLPTMSSRFDAIFTSPLRFALGMHDLIMCLAHVGMLVCAIALLLRRPRAARPALFLVTLVFGANLAWEVLLQQYDLILPACLLGLFSALPLGYLLHAARRRRDIAENPADLGRRVVMVCECIVAALVLFVSGSIALERPLDQLLHGDDPAVRPSRPTDDRRPPRTEPAAQVAASGVTVPPEVEGRRRAG